MIAMFAAVLCMLPCFRDPETTTVHVRQINSSGSTVGGTGEFNSGDDIHITVDSTAVKIWVYSTAPTTDTIGRITILSNSATQNINFYVAQPPTTGWSGPLEEAFWTSTSDGACKD